MPNDAATNQITHRMIREELFPRIPPQSLAPGHFGNVNQSFDTRLQFDKGAVVGEVDNFSGDASADWIDLTDERLRIRRELLIPERDAFLFPIVLQDLYSDFVTDIEHLRW